MDYRKVDTGLAGALEEAGDADVASLTVFIHTARVPDEEAISVLKGFGVSLATGDAQIFTATLSPHAVAQLSEQPWVQSIKLSRSLRLKNSSA
jgi:hypothetical protein